MYNTGTWQSIHMDEDCCLNTAGGRSSLGRSLCVQDTLSVAVVECVCVSVCMRACMFKACQQLSILSVISSGAYTVRAWPSGCTGSAWAVPGPLAVETAHCG